MTSRDVRDILSLPAQSSSGISAAAKKPKPTKARAPRVDGITRELYALMGDNAAPLALAALKKPKFKDQLKDTQQLKASRWARVEFQNCARGDRLKLRHWVRDVDEAAGKEPEAYRFAKYNMTSQVFSYSTEEYLHHLRDDDWSREETDYLFSLLQKYDLRFPVVHDRYDFRGSSTPRTIESLKARYYSICAKLLAARPSSADEPERKAQIASYSFDPQREADRKAHVASLIWRTPAQIMEEDFLYIESRRLEQNAVKFEQDRQTLMSTLDGMTRRLLLPSVDPNAMPVMGYSGSAANSATSLCGSAVAGPSGLKRGRQSETAGLECADFIEPSNPATAGRNISKCTLASDLVNCIFRFDGPPPANTPSVTLRSTRIAQPKAAIATRVSAVLAELGMPETGKQLVMPTRGNVARFEELQAAVVTMLELKKQLERVETEVQVWRRKREAAAGACTSGGGEGDEELNKMPRASSTKRSPSVSSVGSASQQKKKQRR